MRTVIYCQLLMLFLANTIKAQDTIIQTNGGRIIAKVLEVGTTVIKYKKYQNLDTSPIYDIEKYNVKTIRYADGTQDTFSGTAIPQVYTLNYPAYPYNYSGDINNSSLNVTRAYITLGAMISPLNMYQGAAVNNYWQNLYASEGGKGYMQLNNGNALLYSFFMGATLVTGKQNNWGYEFQFEMTRSNNGIHDSASFPDGTNGNFNLWYMSLNDVLQYTRGIDTGNNLQIGAEAGIDIGLIMGGERDDFYSGGSSYPDSSHSADFTGAHVGFHLAAVGKYYFGKSKDFGLELRAGYRFLKGYNPISDGFQGGIGIPVSLSGPFVSIGLVLRLKAHYCINCGFDDDDDW